MEKLPEGTTTANVHTIHRVHSIHYYQMTMTDLLENPQHNEVKLPCRSIARIKGTNIYLQVDDKVDLETYYECTCVTAPNHTNWCPAKIS